MNEDVESNAVVSLDHLVCGYESPVVGPLDARIPAHRFVLVEGPNGVGKSTLLKTLVGLRKPIAGSYRWKVAPEHVRYVPQIRTLDAVLPATVADVVATGTQQGRGWSGLRSHARHGDIDAALDKMDIRHFRSQLFRELSEGQKQMVLLARALVSEAQVVLLDEPAASMDPEREQKAITLLKSEQDRRRLTIVMVAHGSPMARDASDVVLEITRNGRAELRR